MATQNNRNREPMSGLDKFNLMCGIIAIIFLVAALVVNRLPVSAHMPVAAQDWLHYLGLGFMGLYLLTLIALKRKDLGAFFGHKHTKSGMNVTVQILGVIAILVAANYFGARHHGKLDLTQNKQYSLSEQSKAVVSTLKEPINVTVFVKKGDAAGDNLSNLWHEYADAGSQLKLDVVDVDRDPNLARQLKITAVNSSVLQRGDRKTIITGTQEQDLTSGLIKVSENGQKVIYFVTGHGELDTTNSGEQGLSNAKDALEKQNYKLDTLSLFSTKKVPADAAVVVIAGPQKPLLPQEIQALKAYMAGGGHVFASLQPEVDAGLSGLANDYGIVVKNDLVIDPTLNFLGNLAAPAVQSFPSHPITNGLQTAYFLGSRSLDKTASLPVGVNDIPLVETTTSSWGETNMTARPVRYDAGADFKGPLTIMTLAEKGNAKLIVSGDTLFFANASYTRFNNGDLFLKAINYMADEQNLVNIAPKANANHSIDLLPWQYMGIFYGTVLGIPLALLLGAGLVWWRRR